MPRSLVLLVSASAVLALPTGALAAPGRVLHPGTPGVVEAGSPVATIATAKLPVLTAISPRRVAVGHTLTLRGRNFKPGLRTNTVVFQSSGGRYVFVRAARSSTRFMKVTIPKKLASYLRKSKGAAQPTRFRIRVLARRFAAKFSSYSRSPVVTPGPKTTPAAPTSACNLSRPDADKDGLSNALEKKIHTDPCRVDTDGDGMSDFWEYHSALDYNSSASWRDAVMYPGKLPYPNALDPSDKGIDFDGDGLTNWDEYRVWAKCGNTTSPNLFLSDGTQTSHPLGSAQPVTYAALGPASAAAHAGLDLNADGEFTDDERDSELCDPTGAHGDGLGNWVEAHGPMQPSWWTAIVKSEKPYALSRYAGTDFLDPDTDGDGILDGADDVDHDGYSNAEEINRFVLQPGEQAKYGLATSDPLWVQPFNPCLPDPGPSYRNPQPPAGYDDQQPGVPPFSTSCSLHHPPIDQSWPPFDHGGVGRFWNPFADPDPAALNRSNTPLRMDDPYINPAPGVN